MVGGGGAGGGGLHWIKDNCQRESLCTYCIEESLLSNNPSQHFCPLNQPLVVFHTIRDFNWTLMGLP